MRKLMLLMAFVLMPVNSLMAEIKTSEISYTDGKIKMKGFLAWDDARKGKRPGILVVHEWWGHNDYARSRARQLAELGYTALAVDMYGDGKKAEHPTQASEFSKTVSSNLPLAKSRFLAALKKLQKHSSVDAGRIAAVGYCFGGSTVLNMVRAGVDLKGAVSVHGGIKTGQTAGKGKVKARILVLNGAADPFVKSEHIDEFKKEMNAAGADLKFISYPNAKHAFSNPKATELGKKFNIPIEYNEAADRASWAEMKVFFEKLFK